MHALDVGTMGGDQGSWLYLLAMFLVTLAGIFLLSILIGILTTGIEAKLDSLRKGRSRVIESGHTVILGWSDQIFTLVSELVLANANQKHPCIVILGPNDKVEMEDELREKVGDTGRTRLVCRTGNPIEMADLKIVSLETARSIIILAADEDNPDSEVIKTLLAIVQDPQRRPDPYHIVAELHDPKNLEVAKIVAGDEVEIILVGDRIARMVAQTCRQSGLSIVYTELLGFEGDEIYFKAEPSLADKSFGDALFAYETSTVIGIHPQGKSPILNPAMNLRIGPDDRIIAISADDDTVVLSGRQEYAIRKEAVRAPLPIQQAPERALILGWNWRATAIINELDGYVAPGSTVTVVADYPNGEAELTSGCPALQNQTATFQVADTTDRRILDSLDVAQYDHIITLSYSDLMAPHQADALTLITLLHLRDIASKCGSAFSIVSEMLDVRNRNLAEVTRADDFIVSDRLISLVMAQISENKALNAVFDDLFDAEGAEIYLKPAEAYVQPGVPLNFYTVLEAARQRSEVPIGYRLRNLVADSSRNYGVVLNPNKRAEVTFGPGDSIIVVADN
jgi:ion channel POLLUX/CASTOR